MVKEFKAIKEQIEILKDRGLVFENEEFASEKLLETNYYNTIKGYKRLFVELYELGMIDKKTTSGNIVKAYDKERCICDIIRSKNRMDPEQIIYSTREYIKSKDKDLIKLSNYATKKRIKDKVINYVELIYD